jgi:hypothetical protein
MTYDQNSHGAWIQVGEALAGRSRDRKLLRCAPDKTRARSFSPPASVFGHDFPELRRGHDFAELPDDELDFAELA